MYTDDRPTTDLTFGKMGKFKWPYLRERSSDPLHVWFYGGVFEVGGSNGASSGLTSRGRIHVKADNTFQLLTYLITET